jgi:hypothetical protein
MELLGITHYAKYQESVHQKELEIARLEIWGVAVFAERPEAM